MFDRYQTESPRLPVFLEKIEKGQIIVPQSLGPWNTLQKVDLFDSILRGFDIGVISIWRHVVDKKVVDEVIDGRNRARILFQELTGESTICFDPRENLFLQYHGEHIPMSAFRTTYGTWEAAAKYPNENILQNRIHDLGGRLSKHPILMNTYILEDENTVALLRSRLRK